MINNGNLTFQTLFQILLIQKSWKCLSRDMTGKGMRIFKEIFSRNPDTKALFPFRNAKMEDLPNDVKFRGHASRSAIKNDYDVFVLEFSPFWHHCPVVP